MLYGISPLNDKKSTDLNLQPVMSLQSNIIALKDVKQGETVGYGANWQCPEDMKVGIVAIGYGDGYPRHAKSGTPVMINRQCAQVIGNPSMDMITVDLRQVRDVKVGDPVELWGEMVAVEEVAEHAGTIAYELVSGIQKRLNVIVHDQG